VKTSLLLVASGVVLLSTLLVKPHAAEVAPAGSRHASSTALGAEAHDCGGEPCDAVVRGLFAFFF
jgi:hypothetical protein